MKKLLPILILTAIFLAACGRTGNDHENGYENGYVNAQNNENIEDTSLRIVSLGASNTEIIEALGLAQNIIAIDDESHDVPNVAQNLPQFSMFGLDMEALIALQPDIIIVMDFFWGNSPLAIMYDMTEVIYIQSATSIEDIMADITTIGEALNASAAAAQLVAQTEAGIENIVAKANDLESVTVYFEIDPAPMFTLGQGTWLNELIELAGGINVFASEFGWIQVADEAVLALNPDVIIANTGWASDDVLGGMENRAGWHALYAVQTGRLHLVETNATSRQSHNIANGLEQIFNALHN
ncbi:MAG: ABC transporter substrate-binding protein [Defluviitaleaceae bacterium]|nr:ABC transporter substrate-binding protein [Defluviitaleaceae bacterium]